MEGLLILEEEEKAKEKLKEKENRVEEKEKVVKNVKPAGIPKNNIYYRKNNLKTIKYLNMPGFSSVGRACDCSRLAIS